MPVDYSKLSDAALAQIASGKPIDYSKLSDSDLTAISTAPAEEPAKRDMGLLEKLDSYTGAPVRAAAGAAQHLQNPLSAYAKQFGADPKGAPSGKDLVTDAYGDGMLAGPAGVAMDIAIDPTTYVGGALAKGAGKVLSKAGGAVSPYVEKALAGLLKAAPKEEKIAAAAMKAKIDPFSVRSSAPEAVKAAEEGAATGGIDPFTKKRVAGGTPASPREPSKGLLNTLKENDAVSAESKHWKKIAPVLATAFTGERLYHGDPKSAMLGLLATSPAVRRAALALGKSGAKNPNVVLQGLEELDRAK